MKTFVVRLAEVEPGSGPPADVGPGTLRGVLDEVSTGDRTPFRSTEELVALLETAVVEAPGRPRW